MDYGFIAGCAAIAFLLALIVAIVCTPAAPDSDFDGGEQ